MHDEKTVYFLSVIIDAATEVFSTPISADDNFFDAGGDSIFAIEFAALLESRFGQEIDIGLIFESGSFATLALGLAGLI
jgi:acyl carrier protein